MGAPTPRIMLAAPTFAQARQINTQAGAVMKTLSVKPSNSNDGSWMFYMNQTGPNKTAIAVPVTRAEYKVGFVEHSVCFLFHEAAACWPAAGPARLHLMSFPAVWLAPGKRSVGMDCS